MKNLSKVLVIDDVAENLQLLDEVLSNNGYEVYAFIEPKAGLKAAINNPPDIILLDVMMSGIDGFKVASLLKANKKTTDIPILFVSALSDSKSRLEGFFHGGVDFITKPFHEKEVLARVSTHLKIRSYQNELSTRNVELEAIVEEKTRDLTLAHMSVVWALIKLTEARDQVTGGHIDRVQHYCILIAENLRSRGIHVDLINDQFIDQIFKTAPLHDIGKIAIPDEILNKPGPLTTDEFKIIKTHTTIGADTLEELRSKFSKNEFLHMGVKLTRYHHERWDGTGYPEGLRGEDIPLSARIMSLSDCYDAIRSPRPYKPAVSHEHAVSLIKLDSGRHFDPEIVNSFLQCGEDFRLIYDQMSSSKSGTTLERLPLKI